MTSFTFQLPSLCSLLPSQKKAYKVLTLPDVFVPLFTLSNHFIPMASPKLSLSNSSQTTLSHDHPTLCSLSLPLPAHHTVLLLSQLFSFFQPVLIGKYQDSVLILPFFSFFILTPRESILSLGFKYHLCVYFPKFISPSLDYLLTSEILYHKTCSAQTVGDTSNLSKLT